VGPVSGRPPIFEERWIRMGCVRLQISGAELTFYPEVCFSVACRPLPSVLSGNNIKRPLIINIETAYLVWLPLHHFIVGDFF
jgi:hypothetical protein